MNRAERRAYRRACRGSGLNVVTRAVACSSCGDTAFHVEMWEGDDEALGLPIELGRCECGGFWLSVRNPASGSQ